MHRIVSRLNSSILATSYSRVALPANSFRAISNCKNATEDFETLALSDDIIEQPISNYGVAPIVTSSFFLMDSAISNTLDASRANDTAPKCFEYSRLRNPTREAAESLLSKLEGAKHTRTFASGMAALSSVVGILNHDDHVVSLDTAYNGTYNLMLDLKAKGMPIDFAKSVDVDDILSLINGKTKMILLEGQVNPILDLVDLSELVKQVRKLRHGSDIIIAVDNTFLSPIFSQPLKLGVDIVVHSCTKYLNGHGDVIMGSVSTNSDVILKRLHTHQIKFGAIPSPFDCYLLMRGLRTLPLRMQQHSRNALQIATWLESHPSVEKVLYTGLPSHHHHHISKKQNYGDSGMVGFYIKGDFENSSKFLESTKLLKRAPSLGTHCSLASLPARLSHASLSKEQKEKAGILETFIRLSVGLEGVDALIEDLDQSLQKSRVVKS